MGFNISGIAINASYENKLHELQEDLKLTLTPVEDVTFEKASSNWTEEGVAYVFFSENRTLLFLHMDMCINPFMIKGRDTLTYALSETSMAFCLNYCEDMEVKRYIMEHNGEKMTETGQPFDFEKNCGDTSEVIWKKLDDIIDIPFGSIDLGAAAKKCKVSFGKPNSSKDSNNEKKESIGSKEHQKQLEVKYREFTDDQLIDEFELIRNIPNARTNIQCLVEVAALLAISKERGINLQDKKSNLKNKGNKGCAPVLLAGLIIFSSVATYVIKTISNIV